MNLYILSLREGCLEVVISIPEATYEKYFPLTLDRSRALENLTYEPVGLKFKSVYYSDTLIAESDKQDIPFTDAQGQTNSKNTITDDDALSTHDIYTYDGVRKHRLGSNNHKDEDSPFDIIRTDLSDKMSEQNEAHIELDHILQS
uniref:Uncharacterized protein n=1 Tax=Amphimedon queenslandica TaxID=400682 RepID=A0A1X7TH52_AMPQE